MLVLHVRPGDRVAVGDVIVEFLEFRQDGVRLGFIAPRSIPILRENAKIKVPKHAMDNSPGNPTPVSPAAKIVEEIDLP
ncbi:MAG: carbon storage regulator [Acidobacteria bacterium]|nr:carbon storage regulator [Acidobacteriota bacterium]